MATYRTTLRGLIQGQTMAIVRYWTNNELTPDFQAFADEWGDVLAGTWDNAVHTACVLNDIYISNALPESLGIAVTPLNFPLVGTLAETGALPPHDAILAVYSSAVLSYPRMNRNRLGGGVESQIEGGVLTAGAQTTWDLVAQALATSLTVGESVWSAVLWSDTYANDNTIGNITVRAAISTQNSRKVGSGN